MVYKNTRLTKNAVYLTLTAASSGYYLVPDKWLELPPASVFPLLDSSLSSFVVSTLPLLWGHCLQPGELFSLSGAAVVAKGLVVLVAYL